MARGRRTSQEIDRRSCFCAFFRHFCEGRMAPGIQYKPNPLTCERQGQNSPDTPGRPGNDERFACNLTQRIAPVIALLHYR
jgi:hypothetical protein